jgi:V8-like Glu-specific endopeptidase
MCPYTPEIEGPVAFRSIPDLHAHLSRVQLQVLHRCRTSRNGARRWRVLLQTLLLLQSVQAPQEGLMLRSMCAQGTSVRRPPRYPFGYGRRRLTQTVVGVPGIIGRDDRTLVNSTFPYTAIVRLVYVVNGVRASQCSAFFVGNKALLTTASCVFNKDTQTFYDLGLIAIMDSLKRQISAAIDAVVVPVQYMLGFDNHDVAVVTLSSATNFQDVYGYLGHGLACDIAVSPALLLGYPSKCHLTCCAAQAALVCTSPRILEVLDTSLIPLPSCPHSLHVRHLPHPCALTPPLTSCRNLTAVSRRDGRMVVQSTCPYNNTLCNTVLIPHTCDMTPGETGGPLLTSADFVVRGVALGILRSKANSAVLLDDAVATFIQEAIDMLAAA